MTNDKKIQEILNSIGLKMVDVDYNTNGSVIIPNDKLDKFIYDIDLKISKYGRHIEVSK